MLAAMAAFLLHERLCDSNINYFCKCQDCLLQGGQVGWVLCLFGVADMVVLCIGLDQVSRPVVCSCMVLSLAKIAVCDWTAFDAV